MLVVKQKRDNQRRGIYEKLDVRVCGKCLLSERVKYFTNGNSYIEILQKFEASRVFKKEQ